MGNLYSNIMTNIKPFTFCDEREAMDTIMEIAEEKMDEGDYLKISKCLKVIYDAKPENTQQIIYPSVIMSRSAIDQNALYLLTYDETITIMQSRCKLNYENCIETLKISIPDLELQRIQIADDKKAAWKKLQQERTDDNRKYHKQLVQREKNMKAELNEYIRRLPKLERTLQDFAMGDYSTVDL
jgi:hypothetical protein